MRAKAQRSLSVVEGKLNGTERGQSMLSALEELAANLGVRQRGIDGLEGEAAGWEARITGLRTLIVQLEQGTLDVGGEAGPEGAVVWCEEGLSRRRRAASHVPWHGATLLANFLTLAWPEAQSSTGAMTA